MNPTLKHRLKFLLTGKLPKASSEPIQRHVKPYLSDAVQVGDETLYRLSEWAHKPITFDHPTFQDRDGKRVKVWKAFKCGDTEIWTCDPGDLPSFRYRKWGLVQEEWQLGLSKEFLDGFQTDLEATFKGNEDATAKAFNAFQEFKVRRQMVRTEDLMFKLISLVYFTEGENLADYNFHEQIDKITMWKKYKEPSDFFFGRRMLELLGLDFTSKDILEQWMKMNKTRDFLLKKGLLNTLGSTSIDASKK